MIVDDEIIADGVAELENVRCRRVTAEKVRLYGECRIDEVIETSKSE